jgi:cleavage and polyadenylation specificity factor subunit 1
MLQDGKARHPKSPWSSALHIVPKKDNGWRSCGDYRALNSRTIPERYPVRHIHDYSHQSSGCGVFSKIDLVRAYNQILVHSDDNQKTAITIHFGLFEFPFISFGLPNAAQTFQRFFDDILRGLEFCFAYLDDTLIFSRTPEEHEQHLRTLFYWLRRYGILGNPAKCILREFEVTFLGYKVSAEGSRPLEERVAHLQNCSPPKTASQLRRFLGMLKFYRRFLPHAPTFLANPDPSAPLALVTDASTSAMSAVLQKRVDNAWQPHTFSKKLNSTQQKYSAYHRKLLAVCEEVKHFRHMLEARHFTIFTEHKPVTFAFQQKRNKCSPRQFNHLDYIDQFTTAVRHISRQNNVVADALSRVQSITAPPSHDARPHRRRATTSFEHF